MAKRKLNCGLKIWIFFSREQYFTPSLLSFVKYCFVHSKITVISSHHRVLSRLYTAVPRKVVLQNEEKRTRQCRKFLLRCFSGVEGNSTNTCIQKFSFRPAKSPWTSIKQRETLTTHNTNRIVAYPFTLLSKHVYCCFEKGCLTYEENLNATMSKVIMGNGCFRVEWLKLNLFQRVERNSRKPCIHNFSCLLSGHRAP